ncbi:MAG: tetratricopeptide repeat protein [Acidobacteria bacterium]|nr:tetratricopeptide repeat protein [Acidobacteriota bacterium]
MSSPRRRRLFGLTVALTAALVAFGSCRRGVGGAAGRIALLPFENLSSDTSLDWVGPAAAGMLGAQLTGAGNLQPVVVESVRDVPARGVTLVLHGYFTLLDGQIRLHGSLRETAVSRTIRQIEAAGPRSGGVLPLLERFARQLSPQAKPLPTRSEEAARTFWTAASLQDRSAIIAHLRQAVAADPAFGAAWQALVQALVAGGDTAAARAALDQARAHAGRFDAMERARLDLLRATVENDPKARLKALTELARLAPAEAGLWRSLGDLRLLQKDYPGAVEAFERALKIEPKNIALWNTLGYAHAYAGDLVAAVRNFEEYRRLAPNDANALDSLGEVHFLYRRFGEAEKYFLQAHEKNAAMMAGGDLYRAALSRFLAGDRAGADRHITSYLTFRKQRGDPLLNLHEALWEHATGRREQAVSRLQRFTERKDLPGDAAAAAAAQLAIFRLESGEFDRASEAARVAFEKSTTPAVRNLAVICRFLAEPRASVSAWREAAATLFRAPALAPFRNQVTGYALLFHRRFAEAVPVWKQIYDETHPNVIGDAQVMLAWACAGSGDIERAQAFLRYAPLPPRGTDAGLNTLTLPKYLELLARLQR